MTTAAIIVAAGRGTRVGGVPAKQWRSLAGRRMLDRVIESFQLVPGIAPIVLALSPEDRFAWREFADRDMILARGGANRSASVRNALATLSDLSPQRVLVHDAARPCVSTGIIERVMAALDSHSGAAPALPVTDALWSGTRQMVTGTCDRSGLYAAQTPQGFHYRPFVAAHAAHPGGAADDVEVALAGGMDVAIVPGDADNIKVTTLDDISRAERILRGEMDIRQGNGIDVHAFGVGDHISLCGERIPHERGLAGHSDADVGMHAISDAMYGALAEGDIGRHFPPSDPRWKDADSQVFLRHATAMATDRGYRISNVDCTLVCESPAITPHAEAMRIRLAEIMQIDAGRISVKATTSERLGFTGRREGIAAFATATLVKP